MMRKRKRGALRLSQILPPRKARTLSGWQVVISVFVICRVVISIVLYLVSERLSSALMRWCATM